MKKIVLILIYHLIMRNLLRLFLGVLLTKRLTLPAQKACIIVANHNSHLDTIAILSLLPAHQIHRVHPVAAADHFGKTTWQAKCANFFINTLLIPRKRPKTQESPDPFALMLDALDQGKSLVLFPEGTRGQPEQLGTFKKGIGYLLAARPTVAYIPVFTKGLGDSLPKGSRILLPFLSQVRIGTPQYAHSQCPEQIVEEVTATVVALGKQ